MIWRLLLLLLAPALTAAAERTPDPCALHGDRTACYVAHSAPRLALFGLAPIETRLAAGDHVYRTMIFGRVGNPMVAVEFSRVAGQEPAVAIYRPADADQAGIATPAYIAAVPLAEWDRIGEAARLFDRQLVPLPPDPHSNAILVCTDAWTFVVESSEPAVALPGPRIRRQVEDACDQGTTYAFALELANTAARLLPACASLDDRDRFSPLRLSLCAKLGGDRAAGALVFNRLELLRWQDRADALRGYFYEDAVLESQGQAAHGALAAAHIWLSHGGAGNEANFFPDRLIGASADSVTVLGHLEHWERRGSENILLIAPVNLTFVRAATDRSFRITRGTIGAFAPAPHFCDDVTLVAHCR